MKIDDESAGDTITISIITPDASCNYKWYASDTDIRPISGFRDREAGSPRINRDGTIIKVPKATKTAAYYVAAVSKTTSAFSKRLRVETRK